MSEHAPQDRTLAFAGILQALHLVQQTAHGKPCDLTALRAFNTQALLSGLRWNDGRELISFPE